MLLEEGVGLPALAFDQAVEVRPGQAQVQLLPAILGHTFSCDRAGGVELRAQSGFSVLEQYALLYYVLAQPLGNRLRQQVQPLPVPCGEPDTYRHSLLVALYLRLEVLKQVDLVVDLENRQLKGADLAQRQMHLLDIGSPLGIGGVDHMPQLIGLTGFLQRGTEGLYQLLRQMADETYGGGQHDRAYIDQLDAAQGRIQGREQLIGGVYRRLGQPVEQGGFAGVGIADQGDHGDFRPSPCTSGLITLAADLLQTLGDLLDAHPQQTAVGFQLGFPRTTQADTTLLPLKVGPAADQTGTQMIELGQLDLQLALVGTGALGEDIQNQTGRSEEHTSELQSRPHLVCRLLLEKKK